MFEEDRGETDEETDSITEYIDGQTDTVTEERNGPEGPRDRTPRRY